MRALAAATARSKSRVQRHVALCQAGGNEALVPHKRGPKVASQPHRGGPRGRERGLARGVARPWPRRRSPDDRLAHDHRRWRGAGPLDHPPGAGTPGTGHTPSPIASPFELATVRSDLPNECWRSFIDDHSRGRASQLDGARRHAAEVVRTFYESVAITGYPPRRSVTMAPLHGGLPGQPHRHEDRAGSARPPRPLTCSLDRQPARMPSRGARTRTDAPREAD